MDPNGRRYCTQTMTHKTALDPRRRCSAHSLAASRCCHLLCSVALAGCASPTGNVISGTFGGTDAGRDEAGIVAEGGTAPVDASATLDASGSGAADASSLDQLAADADLPDGSASDSGTAGIDGGGGCSGVPIVPDATGLVAAGSNSLGIHGSWFVYSDCVDLNGKNCSMVADPPANSFPNVGGKMCTSGQTSSASGAWGAGIALELSDGPPQQPYDTTAHGVVGFCFQLSGPTIPSTTIRVAFPTKDNNDNAYFEAVSTPGMHSVLFSDTAQGSWVTTKAAFEPTKVMLMQFQIPSSTTAAVPWNFCVDGLTALTQ